MTGKERIRKVLNHQPADKIAVDFGATTITGIHVRIIAMLREYFGLKKVPVKVIEPYQMLGEIDSELAEKLGADVIGIFPQNNMFGIKQANWKEWKTPWGQYVMVPEDFNTTVDATGNVFIYPEGDTTIAACAKMPAKGYFFDALNRQGIIDEDKLQPEDNLEEFGYWKEEDIQYWKTEIKKYENSDKAIAATFGGTALGDIALVPAMQLKNPKGIRDVSEWYMSTMMRPDYIKSVFEKQVEIAISNLSTAFEIVGNKIDVVVICGTDFGTQDSSFCAPETFDDLWLPYYKEINDWIHENTQWKTFKHSCGAVEPFMDHFIKAGFDIINPVQINAKGMDPVLLKEKYGDQLVFWGGGVDTQKVLPFGTPEEVKSQVFKTCEIFSANGGFVFNSVHNIQANVPIENLVAMLEALQEIKKS